MSIATNSSVDIVLIIFLYKNFQSIIPITDYENQTFVNTKLMVNFVLSDNTYSFNNMYYNL